MWLHGEGPNLVLVGVVSGGQSGVGGCGCMGRGQT